MFSFRVRLSFCLLFAVCSPITFPLCAEEMPDLHQWMIDNSIISASFASEWFLTLFSAHSVDAAVRIWDVFLLEGTSFLYKVAAGICAVAVGFTLTQACCAALLALKKQELFENPEGAMDILKGKPPCVRRFFKWPDGFVPCSVHPERGPHRTVVSRHGHALQIAVLEGQIYTSFTTVAT
jgi:hypothetical protein